MKRIRIDDPFNVTFEIDPNGPLGGLEGQALWDRVLEVLDTLPK